MAYNTVWTEKAESRECDLGRSDPTGKLVYTGTNLLAADDDTDANLALLAIIPLLYPGIYYAYLTYSRHTVKALGGGAYEGTVTYTRKDQLYTFDTGGGTQRITHSLLTRGAYGASTKATSQPCKSTNGSAVVTVLSTGDVTQIAVGMKVSGTGITAGTTVSSISGNDVTLSATSSETTGDPQALQFAWLDGIPTLTLDDQGITIICDTIAGNPSIGLVPPATADVLTVGVAVTLPDGTNCIIMSIDSDVDVTLSVAPTFTARCRILFNSGRNTSLLRAGITATAQGLDDGSVISSIDSATQITLTLNPTANSRADGSPVTFSEPLYLTFTSASSPPPDFKNAINVKEDSVEGVEVETPAFHFEITLHVNPAFLTPDFEYQLFIRTGTVNLDTFRIFAPGECKFLGCRGSQKGQEDVELTFRFAGSPNRSNFKVGAITVGFKRGWDYMWVRSVRTLDSVANVTVQVPRAVYIEQVSYESTFDFFRQLGLG